MELYLEKLAERFKRVLSIRSTRNKNEIDIAWKTIMQAHAYRPYHNLRLAFHDLSLNCNGVPIYISDEIAMAIFFRHTKYHPINHNIEKSIEYMIFMLSEMFGWAPHKVGEVSNLMRASESIENFILPEKNEMFNNSEFLIRDMKMSRLAKPYTAFTSDRENLVSELSKDFTLTEIFTMEYKVFKALQKRPALFLTTLCKKEFTELTQENLHKRLTWLSTECNVIKDKIDKKELVT